MDKFGAKICPKCGSKNVERAGNKLLCNDCGNKFEE